MIKNKTTGKHSNFIGPTLIHQDRKFSTYHYFASEIKKLHPAMQGLVSFGTDGEEALSSAFLSVFPRSVHSHSVVSTNEIISLENFTN